LIKDTQVVFALHTVRGNIMIKDTQVVFALFPGLAFNQT